MKAIEIRFCDKCGLELRGCLDAEYYEIINMPFTIIKVKRGKKGIFCYDCYKEIRDIMMRNREKVEVNGHRI